MARTSKIKREDSGTDADPARRVASNPVYGSKGDEKDLIARKFEEAIRNGTHGPGCGHFCTGCRQLVQAIYWGDGMSKTTLCEKCYEKIKGAPITHTAYSKPRTKVYRANFEDALLWWAKDHFFDAFKAFAASDAKDWEDRVLASIVRRRAMEEKGWLNTIIEGEWFSDLVRLATKVIRAGGYPIDPKDSFADAIRKVRSCPI